jgi:hypothetical protein
MHVWLLLDIFLASEIGAKTCHAMKSSRNGKITGNWKKLATARVSNGAESHLNRNKFSGGPRRRFDASEPLDNALRYVFGVNAFLGAFLRAAGAFARPIARLHTEAAQLRIISKHNRWLKILPNPWLQLSDVSRFGLGKFGRTPSCGLCVAAERWREGALWRI